MHGGSPHDIVNDLRREIVDVLFETLFLITSGTEAYPLDVDDDVHDTKTSVSASATSSARREFPE